MRKSQHMTSVSAIEKAALELIAQQGFDHVTVEDIAAAAGISRRTFFRYFSSKNEIPFSEYGALLVALEEWLASEPDDRPIFDVIADAVMRFNRVHTDGGVAHRERMRLVMRTPSLRANAALHQDDWVAVLARYAARRLDTAPDELVPQLIAQVALGTANTAYEQWLNDESSDLGALVDEAFSRLQELSSLPSTR
ncbi:MAG: TetR family transcriptional regulator [Actinomycetota bacterium]|nr:TetR family transcriptional regulator [Actinomycetota bacterium]